MILLCEPPAVTMAVNANANETNCQQEIGFKSGDMKDNYQEIIKFLNRFYSITEKKSTLLDPENDVKTPGGDARADVEDYSGDNEEKEHVNHVLGYCIYLVDKDKYEQVVGGCDASQVNEMIKSRDMMNELQLSLNHKIENGEDLKKCYQHCDQCVLYVCFLRDNSTSDRNETAKNEIVNSSIYYLYVKHDGNSKCISFKWVPTQFIQNSGDGSDSDDIEWEDEFTSLQTGICEKFNLENNDNLKMHRGEPLTVIANNELKDGNENGDTIDDEDDLHQLWDEILELGEQNGESESDGDKLHYCAVVHVAGDIAAEVDTEENKVDSNERTIVDKIRALGMFSDVNDELLLSAIKLHNNDVSRTIQWGLSFGDKYSDAFEKLTNNRFFEAIKELRNSKSSKSVLVLSAVNNGDSKEDNKEQEFGGFALKPDMPIKSGVYIIPTIKKEDIDKNRIWKTIMVIGETGSGKSTTLNSMVNYLWHVSLEDHYRFVLIPPPAKKSDQSKSVTSEVTSYHFQPPGLDYGITIVDTPGMCCHLFV